MSEHQTHEHTATHNPAHEKVEVKFHFKTVVDEKTKEKTKRPDVILDLPLLTLQGIVDILNSADSKAHELLVEAVRDVQLARAREIVNGKEDVSKTNFPLTEVEWSTIANLPKAERRGGGIAKEVWEDFGKDYVATMTQVGISQEAAAAAADLLIRKFNPVKTQKAVIKKLQERLAMYYSNTPNTEDFRECVEFLNEKATKLLSMNEEELLENL